MVTFGTIVRKLGAFDDVFYCWQSKSADKYPLSQLAWAAKVHYFDSAPLGVTEEDVLRLQVTVDDAELRRGQKKQRRA